MGPYQRAVVIVCDGLGVGAAPDADLFGDGHADTLGHVLSMGHARIPNLAALGLGNLPPTCSSAREAAPRAGFGRLAEKSAGKDTATGHWEMMGLLTETAFKLFPGGFPASLVERFSKETGRAVLGNKAASGTEILKELGEEHVATGALIVYTSGDSVFQIAAHEKVVPPAELYRYCRIAYHLACEELGVCRVIARPFVGDGAATYKRTPNRRDFAVPPAGQTLLDYLAAASLPVYGVGKIEDIFSSRGIKEAVHTVSDDDGVNQTIAALGRWPQGLIFTNLVDFDTLYGHRNDVQGFARNLEGLDARIPDLLAALREDDLLILTGDHGCDPSDESTDHTREFVPLLAAGKRVRPGALGDRESFSDIAATLAENFGLGAPIPGASFLQSIAS
ncbi:MAG: phosphopentomutase [Vicinamibacteria bacterium]|nr:phosphopentomutase [Vicinamibacteria bacterium]